MNPNFILYVNPNVLDKAALAVKNLQHSKYNTLVSSNTPKVTDVNILSTESGHFGIVFDWLFTPFLARDWKGEMADISVVVWYNCVMNEEDLKILGSYFSTILLGYKKEFKLDHLLQPFASPPLLQHAVASGYPEKRRREEDDCIE